MNDARTYPEANAIAVKDEIPISGINRFLFHDPFGNRIELLERIK